MSRLCKMMFSYRVAVYLVFLLACCGISASFFAQYVLGMNPCVMCIQQRMALIGIALVALVCVFLPLRKIWGKTLAALLISAPTLFGAIIAIWQTYIQTLPLMEQPDCGAPWTFRLRNAPLFDLYEPIIRGSGVCGEIYRVLGVSLPVWSAGFFITMLLVLWVMYFRTLRK